MSIAYQPLDLWGTLGTLRDPERHRDRLDLAQCLVLHLNSVGWVNFFLSMLP